MIHRTPKPKSQKLGEAMHLADAWMWSRCGIAVRQVQGARDLAAMWWLCGEDRPSMRTSDGKFLGYVPSHRMGVLRHAKVWQPLDPASTLELLAREGE